MVSVLVPPGLTGLVENEHVVSDGRPLEQARVTALLKPPSAATEMLNVALAPAVTVALVLHVPAGDVELQTDGGLKSCTAMLTVWL